MTLIDKETGYELLTSSQVILFARNLEACFLYSPENCELNGISYDKEKRELIIDYTQTFSYGEKVRYVDAYGEDYNRNISAERIES